MTDLKDQVTTWLETLGCTPTETKDPTAQWHYEFDYPPKSSHRMHAVRPEAMPAGGVLLGSQISVANDHVKAFGELDDDSRRDFLFGLRKLINVVDVDFKLEGAEGPLECPEKVTFMVVRYADGLSLDSFAKTVGAIFKTELNAIWYIQEHLSGGGRSYGGRFDFKRLGI